MDLPENYYHCFLGNGLDAVLVGYSGSMVSDKVGVDRCNWYKSDRYYPEDRLVKVAGRFPIERQLEHAEGSGWYEIAPLGRTWYELTYQGQPCVISSSRQRFEPKKGILFTELEFGALHAQVTTFLHARESLLVERYIFSDEVEFNAWMAPGVWIEDGWDTDPFRQVELASDSPRGSYDLGETRGSYFMELEPAPEKTLVKGNARGLRTHGRVICKYFSILDDRQSNEAAALFKKMIAPGYDAMLAEHTRFWQEYFSNSEVSIPDEQFQSFYDASLYHFKAAQSRVSGGLPVNNLRRTWSSHIFWDSYFLQRALLESNHRDESLEACRFLQRTLEHARRHAQEEFGKRGLKWDWEITHDGRKAYGTLLHMKFQAHNNASYSNEIWEHYQFTQDQAFLAEFLPILEGLATFFMEGIVEKTPRGWEIGPLVGVHESPVKVKNEGISLAGTIAILEHYAAAASLLGKSNGFSRRCTEVATGLRKTLDLLFNGGYFVSAEGATNLNMSSMAPIYPMKVVSFDDPRALLTSDALFGHKERESRGELAGHDSPWGWGVLATILACQGKGDLAWNAIRNTRPAICQFGGMTEVFENQSWNMQYFCTAQAAVATAIHSLLLQSSGERVAVFPAVPRDWQTCSFSRLLAAGLEVSATYRGAAIEGEVRNIGPAMLERTIQFGMASKHLHLEPGESYVFHGRN